ncbi:MAG: DUF1015 domain-containing protein [Clostridiales bacterium]|nr:DUF1015 domain-containing protein [Eubacteriales bacterium]MDH7565523.1 DUF1015 domain-containing protein [Clostridiales bacterium]
MTTGVENLGIRIPSILLPDKSVDMSKWSVVACDQYTSQPEYWARVEALVGKAPSTLHMILPEVYLEKSGWEERVAQINKVMVEYLEQNLLKPQNSCFIYVDRKTSRSQSRKGLILAVDLEKYDYRPGSQTLIRATEGTVLERLPPRIKVRENASLELPHTMLLIDDEGRTVIEPLADKVEQLEKLYDFDLMMGGMHIKGYRVDDENTVDRIFNALRKLSDRDSFRKKYNVGGDKGVLLFAVGDGNHSLAAAKGHWENVKKGLSREEAADHPARFALVEVVNVHDEGLKFEPIHRVVFNVDGAGLLESMVGYFNKRNSKCRYRFFENRKALDTEMESARRDKSCHVLRFSFSGKYGAVVVKNPCHTLEVGTLQEFLDDFIKTDKDIKIDYIHGEPVVDALSSKAGNMGFYLPPMDKRDLFKTVITEGVLPRKTFSMGEAEEKRFYLECRKIKK